MMQCCVQGGAFQPINQNRDPIHLDLPKAEEDALNNLIHRLKQVRMQIALDSADKNLAAKKAPSNDATGAVGSDLMQKSSSMSLAKNEKKSQKLSKKALALIKKDSYFSSRDEKAFNDAVKVLRDEQMSALNVTEAIEAYHSWKLYSADKSYVLTPQSEGASPASPSSPKGAAPTPITALSDPIVKEFRNVELIERFKRINGAIAVTQNNIYFIPAHYGANRVVNTRKVFLRQIRTALRQRFVTRETALELFLYDQNTQHDSAHNSLFFTLASFEDREALAKLLKDTVEDPQESIPRMSALWAQGSVSNFDYLLFLNQRAGRTFHDISQYPVLPWVLSDYTSKDLDLSNESSFRDLSKPVGALNEERLQLFIQRSKDCEQPYLYSTHYSTPGYVAYFLVRSQPDLLLNLHNGKFDVADRLFRDIGATYHCSLTSQGDVKELIPEFFFGDGAFLTNVYNLPLGKLQHQEEQSVDNVRLPAWASSPQEFVRLHREALESPHVSRHLHKWIDLIFGFQQPPQNGAAVHNTFPQYMYEGVDYLVQEDGLDESTACLQSYEFGQMPRCLFEEDPHVQRVTPLEKTEQIVAQQDETIVRLTTEVAGLSVAVTTLQDEVEQKTQTIEELEQKNATLSTQVQELQVEVQTQKVILEENAIKLTDLQSKADKWKKEAKKPPVKIHLLPEQVVNDINSGSEKTTIRKYTHNLEAQVANLLKENERLQDRVSKEKEKNLQKEYRLTKLREEFEDHRKSSSAALRKAMRGTKVDRKTQVLEVENRRLRQELERRNLEIESLRTRLQGLPIGKEDTLNFEDFAAKKMSTVEPIAALSPTSPHPTSKVLRQSSKNILTDSMSTLRLVQAEEALKSVLDKTPIEVPYNYDEEVLLSV